VLHRLSALLFRFRHSTRGAILVETIIVVPIVTIFALGVAEFGTLLWTRQQVQAGVRDAARYWSRCTPVAGVSICTLDKARRVAFYGMTDPPTVGCQSTSLRLKGWCLDSQLTVTPATPSRTPGPTDVLTVTGTMTYSGSPVFRLVSRPIVYTYTVEARYIGW